jgi:hypothetical protein
VPLAVFEERQELVVKLAEERVWFHRQSADLRQQNPEACKPKKERFSTKHSLMALVSKSTLN